MTDQATPAVVGSTAELAVPLVPARGKMPVEIGGVTYLPHYEVTPSNSTDCPDCCATRKRVLCQRINERAGGCYEHGDNGERTDAVVWQPVTTANAELKGGPQ